MIIPFFPPMAGGGVYRPLSFVKYLGRHGWHPTVIAPRGDSFWIRDEGLVEQVPDECEVIRTDTLSGQSLLARLRGRSPASQRRSSRRFALVRRLAAATLMPDTYRGWKPYALRAARRTVSVDHFDALYSTSPPETSHLVARDIHRETGLPWVADFRDPWMNLYLLRPPTAVHAWLHRRMERSVCRQAHVVVTTRWHEQLLRARYPNADVTRIANGYDGAEAASVASTRPGDGPMRITHAGMLTQNRSAVPFLRGLRRFLHARPDAAGNIDALFVGAREDENELAAHGLGLGDVVRFADTAAHGETLQIERSSHILLLIKHVNPDYDGLVPGKLYEYVGLRRPILAIAPEGEAADIVTGLGRGEVARPEDEADVAGAIGRMYDAWRAGNLEESYQLDERADMTREHHAAAMAALLARVSAGGEGTP
jgi:hypothetical protein